MLYYPLPSIHSRKRNTADRAYDLGASITSEKEPNTPHPAGKARSLNCTSNRHTVPPIDAELITSPESRHDKVGTALSFRRSLHSTHGSAPAATSSSTLRNSSFKIGHPPRQVHGWMYTSILRKSAPPVQFYLQEDYPFLTTQISSPTNTLNPSNRSSRSHQHQQAQTLRKGFRNTTHTCC